MKVILFDIIGVLIPNLTGGSKKCLKNLYDNLHHPSISFDEFYSRYKKFMVGSITKYEFWKNIKEDVDSIEKTYLDSYKIVANLDTIISPLQKEYILAAVSNHPAPWMKYIINKFHLKKYFKKIYVSGEVGKSKPDKELFNLVVRELNVKASDCALLDDQNKNLIVAAGLSFKTIHLKTIPDPVIFKPDLEIASLEQLNSTIYQIFNT